MSEVKSNASGDRDITIVDNGLFKKQLAVDGDEKKKKKRLSTYCVFKAAFDKLRGPRAQKQMLVLPIKQESKGGGYWKKVIGSMRPMHLQQSNSKPSSPTWKSATAEAASHPTEEFFPDLSQPASPGTSTSSFEAGMSPMTQYASANNLQELDDRKYNTGIDVMSTYVSVDKLQDLENHKHEAIGIVVDTMIPYASDNNLQELDNHKPSAVGIIIDAMRPYGSANNLDDHKQDGGMDSMSPFALANDLQELDNHKQEAAGTVIGTISKYASANNLQELDDHKHDAGFCTSKHRHCASALNFQDLDNHKHDTMMRHSRYACTNNLQLFDDQTDEDDDEDPDEVFDGYIADEMIDAKADDFIARFHQQMKVQSRNYQIATTGRG